MALALLQAFCFPQHLSQCSSFAQALFGGYFQCIQKVNLHSISNDKAKNSFVKTANLQIYLIEKTEISHWQKTSLWRLKFSLGASHFIWSSLRCLFTLIGDKLWNYCKGTHLSILGLRETRVPKGNPISIGISISSISCTSYKMKGEHAMSLLHPRGAEQMC